MSLSHTNLTNNLALWRVFIEVCHKGSISAVAKDHQVDPSTISRKLSALESSLGVRFLSRSTRSLSLTTAGVDALMQAQSMLDVYDDFLQKIKPDTAHLKGLVRIAAPPTIIDELLWKWLAEFQRLHPDVHINMLANSEAQEPNRDSVDIALVTGYIEKYGMPKHPSELINHRALRYSGGMAEKRLFVRRGHVLEPLTFNATVFSSSVYAINQMAIAGMGIALTTPDYLCRRDIEAGRLVRVLPDWPIPDHLVHAVVARDRYRSHCVMEILKCIKHGWRSHPDLKS